MGGRRWNRAALVAALLLAACTSDVAVAPQDPTGPTDDIAPTGPTDDTAPTGPTNDGAEERDRPDKVAVPRLVGLTLAEARSALREAGLRLHTSAYPSFDGATFDVTSVRQVVSTRPPGTVVQQSIDARTLVRPGREVRVVVAMAAPGPCDDSYPDVCIPPYPPDLDCPQVGYVNIRVVGSDPHGLDDGGTPGVGCET
jgi:hypothetical protein